MNDRQRELARHALGLSKNQKVTYRNYFVAGPGHADYRDWLAMVARGEAVIRGGSPLSGGDPVFYLTPLGLELTIMSSTDELISQEEHRSARAARDRYALCDWLPIADAPEDGTEVEVYAPAYAGLPDCVCYASYHQDAGWCVCELRTVTAWRPKCVPTWTV